MLGIMFTEISGHKSLIVKEMTRKFIKKFKKELGYIKCVKLEKEYINVKRCTLMIEIGAEILEDIILKEQSK